MNDKEVNKLCKLKKKKYIKTNLEEYKDLVKNPKFVCLKCGRVANEKKYLCKPAVLE